MLDEPTQGIDIAAKAQIHALLRDFAARGGGVLLSSSDLAELANLCDAVLALRHGSIVARIERERTARRGTRARRDRDMKAGEKSIVRRVNWAGKLRCSRCLFCAW